MSIYADNLQSASGLRCFAAGNPDHDDGFCAELAVATADHYDIFCGDIFQYFIGVGIASQQPPPLSTLRLPDGCSVAHLWASDGVGRLAAGFIWAEQMRPGPTISNRFDVLSLFVLSFLWTAGFILMINQRLQSDLNDLAMNDALTRVRNRRAMQLILDFEMRRVHQEVKEFSIIFLDVDHFKKVNDAFGHDVGDIALQWLASTLQKCVRIQDVVARWGGEEFLILLPDTDLEEAVEIAERLRNSVASALVEIPTGALTVTFSAGVSCSTSSQDVNELCKLADLALYKAKKTRNQVISQGVQHPNEIG